MRKAGTQVCGNFFLLSSILDGKATVIDQPFKNILKTDIK